MPKKKGKSETKALNAFFDRILNVFHAEGGSSKSLDLLAHLKHTLISSEVNKMAVKDFTLPDALVAYGLVFKEEFSGPFSGKWRIEDIPEMKGFQPSHCLSSLIMNYSKNFDRSSEAACRTALDFILNECLTVMKANNEDQPTTTQCTPMPWDDVKIFAEMSFTHTITHPVNTKSATSYLGKVVNGRIDHGIGRAFHSLPAGPRKRRFQSLLLVVEAKTARNLTQALPQLVVYLASLHQSRLQQQRSDATVYGVVSDGYAFIFVAITHDGELKQSRQFDIAGGGEDIVTVLGCLRYLLQTSADMSPNVTREEDGESLGSDIDVDSDSQVDLDDSPYMTT